MTYPLRVRSAMAMRVVNLDRQKFNEAVANGQYPCAPSTVKGSARAFDSNDLLSLFFFARLTEFGLSASKAGKMACEMAMCARDDTAEPATRIIYVHGSYASGFFIANKVKRPADGVIADNYDPEHETPNEAHPTGWHYPGNGRVVFTIEFYIKHVREMIAERIDYERSILGEEEE